MLKILLRAGVVIEPPPEGRLDVFANRPLLLAEGEDRSVLDDLVANYDREPVRDAARRAAGLAGQCGIDAVPSSPAGGRVGVVQLVPTWQHTPGSIWQRLLHPRWTGGYSEWAMPSGAPPN